MKNLIDCFKNKKVLITGHTGFKGSWLALWLNNIGANVLGTEIFEVAALMCLHDGN